MDELRANRTPFLARLPLASERPWIGYAAAIALSLFAWWLRWVIDDRLPPGSPFLTFFPAVIVTAFFFGLRPGILAATLSGFAAWYFFVVPLDFFAIGLNSALAMGFYILNVAVDIALVHWMQTANRDLSRERQRSLDLAENREVLFRELQHRVGNNLQMVASLIALQKRRVEDDSAKTALDEAARRLGLVGRIQRQLYDPAGAQLSLAAYIDQICRDVIAASGREGIDYSFEARTDTHIAPEKAIPTALVVAEAINNALEHGMAGQERGHIVVAVESVDGLVAVTIGDDGVGMPPGFDPEKSESLGLKIARTLAQSLGGSFSMTARPVGRGTLARLEIGAATPAPPPV